MRRLLFTKKDLKKKEVTGILYVDKDLKITNICLLK